jgi:hypothetical protein
MKGKIDTPKDHGRSHKGCKRRRNNMERTYLDTGDRILPRGNHQVH